MIVAGSTNPLLLASAAGGYNLTNSLRFRNSASAYLNRTPASASNRKTWTISLWAKGGVFTATNSALFSRGLTGTNEFTMDFNNDSKLRVYDFTTSNQLFLVTTAVFRDPSAWYHIVFSFDTTQATSSNRAKLYVNGSQITAFDTAIYPAQNYDGFVNTAAQHNICRTSYGYLDGYLTEVNFIDGQALTPSSFGATSATTGVWQPKKYAGTYGTNGFYLPFTDNSALTTSSNVGLGKDFSGNGNYWTTNNISITSGVTYDSMTDVPTLTSATAANYCVYNPLAFREPALQAAFSNANLQANFDNSGSYEIVYGTIAVRSGKWYWENTVTAVGSEIFFGVADINGAWVPVIRDYANSGIKVTQSGSAGSYGATFTTGDIIGTALDLDNGTITFYKNNVSQGVAFTDLLSAMPAGGWTPSARGYNTAITNVNFGQRPFAYTPPTGFVALNTFNLPTPTIGATASTQANKYMNIALYTGTGSSQSITGLGFQPDWTWIKERNAAADHGLYDAVRGVQKQLESNTTTAETTETTGLTAFSTDGFTVGALAQLNTSGDTYVAWNWKANGTGVTNTAGSITSTVSANTSSGFSVVSFTVQSSGTATVGHGLGVAPSMIIWKSLNSSSWLVYHKSIGTNFMVLNTVDPVNTDQSIWNSTAPTSTVVSLGTGLAGAGNSIMYCFSEIAGYSKFGSYTGNGSTDGPFVFTGFRPAFIMVKRSDASQDWFIWDNKRLGYNAQNYLLFANTTQADYVLSEATIDLLSNGFKIRSTAAGSNANGGTYIYMAFAENPFKYSLAR